jgi:hypothetical protein
MPLRQIKARHPACQVPNQQTGANLAEDRFHDQRSDLSSGIK